MKNAWQGAWAQWGSPRVESDSGLCTSSFTMFSAPLLWRSLWKTPLPLVGLSILNQPGVQTTQRRKWGLTGQGYRQSRVHRYTTAFTVHQTWISVLYHSCSFNSTDSASLVKILVIYCKRDFFAPYTNIHHRLANMFYFLKEIQTIDRILTTSIAIGTILIIWM